MNSTQPSFSDSDYYYYSLSLPNCWQMEDDLAPAALDRFNKAAQEQGISVYRAFARNAQSNLEEFFKDKNIKSTVVLTYDDIYHPTKSCLKFRSLSYISDLKSSLRVAFKDVALAENAIQTNVGDRISIQYLPPENPDDFSWH